MNRLTLVGAIACKKKQKLPSCNLPIARFFFESFLMTSVDEQHVQTVFSVPSLYLRF